MPAAEPSLPPIGLGLWRTDNQQAHSAVLEAFKIGYRAVDTASVYNNEKGVGQAIREAMDQIGLTREEIFVTTKLWNDSHGYDAALKAFDQSLARLGLDRVDMYMIQWPAPGQNLYPEAWRAIIRLRDDGKIRYIGVSNFLPEHIDRLYDETGEKPSVNQMELHPYFQQSDICFQLEARNVKIEAWAPLGCGCCLQDPLFRKLALKYGKTPAQIVLRWHIECGRTAVPKSVKPIRIRENFDVFDFHLDSEDMRQVALLECCRRLGPNPQTFR
ncbi:oxidoreductase [Deltaproteobacteria bacterium Smac51]|nr:oxidoreductase [Deltaproteobacteria bacterium Smac51]